MLRNLYDLDSIKCDNYRPLNEEAVEKLCASIKEVGLKEPIHLFEVAATKELYVISGHHRLEALKKVKRDKSHAHKIFQALVTTGSESELYSLKTVEGSVISNMLRTDLGIIDRAQAYLRLKNKGKSAKDIGKMVQKDKRTIEMTLNVALIPEVSKEFVRQNPKLKDSTVYKLAVKYKKEPDFDIQKALEEAAQKRTKRAGASKEAKKGEIRVKPKEFKETLLAETNLSESDIDKVIFLLGSICSQKEDGFPIKEKDTALES